MGLPLRVGAGLWRHREGSHLPEPPSSTGTSLQQPGRLDPRIWSRSFCTLTLLPVPCTSFPKEHSQAVLQRVSPRDWLAGTRTSRCPFATSRHLGLCTWWPCRSCWLVRHMTDSFLQSKACLWAAPATLVVRDRLRSTWPTPTARPEASGKGGVQGHHLSVPKSLPAAPTPEAQARGLRNQDREVAKTEPEANGTEKRTHRRPPLTDDQEARPQTA